MYPADARGLVPRRVDGAEPDEILQHANRVGERHGSPFSPRAGTGLRHAASREARHGAEQLPDRRETVVREVLRVVPEVLEVPPAFTRVAGGPDHHLYLVQPAHEARLGGLGALELREQLRGAPGQPAEERGGDRLLGAALRGAERRVAGGHRDVHGGDLGAVVHEGDAHRTLRIEAPGPGVADEPGEQGHGVGMGGHAFGIRHPAKEPARARHPVEGVQAREGLHDRGRGVVPSRHHSTFRRQGRDRQRGQLQARPARAHRYLVERPRGDDVGPLEAVRGLRPRAGEDLGRRERRDGNAGRLDGHRGRGALAAVDQEDVQHAVTEDGARVDEGHPAVGPSLVGRPVHRDPQRRSLAPADGHRERVEDGLHEQVVARASAPGR